MNDQFVGLKYQVKTPNSPFLESFEQRFDELSGKTPSDIKAVAGADFYHKPFVISVCVFDQTGFVHLYLRKNRITRVCEVREEN